VHQSAFRNCKIHPQKLVSPAAGIRLTAKEKPPFPTRERRAWRAVRHAAGNEPGDAVRFFTQPNPTSAPLRPSCSLDSTLSYTVPIYFLLSTSTVLYSGVSYTEKRGPCRKGPGCPSLSFPFPSVASGGGGGYFAAHDGLADLRCTPPSHTFFARPSPNSALESRGLLIFHLSPPPSFLPSPSLSLLAATLRVNSLFPGPSPPRQLCTANK
jgi:hypothetical protein